VGSGLRRRLYERVVIPRYLRNKAHAWIMETAGRRVGYAVVEQGGDAIHMADIVLEDEMDRPAVLAATLARAEQQARAGEYHYVYVAPVDSSEATLKLYRDLGLAFLDYYLWVFQGQVRDVSAPEAVSLVALGYKDALAKRLQYLKLELDASQAAGRPLIDSTFLPTRPPRHRSFEIVREQAAIGYLSPRPDERQDGILTLALSLEPEYWGTQLEADIAGGFASATSQGDSVPVRVMVSTAQHADRAEESFARLGLERMLDRRPVLFRRVEG